MFDGVAIIEIFGGVGEVVFAPNFGLIDEILGYGDTERFNKLPVFGIVVEVVMIKGAVKVKENCCDIFHRQILT